MPKSDAVQLRVTRRHHTHKGKTYRAGEEFPGTERLLNTFRDRLERASVAQAREGAEKSEAEAEAEQEKLLAELRAEAEGKGVKVDKRWGEDRLREEIKNANASGGK